MNRYLFLHRIKWPVMLLIFGVTALLDQWDVLSYDKSWPLYLIAFGALQLAERAAWAQAQYPDPYAGQPGNWGAPGPMPPPPVTPSDGPRGFGSDDEGRK